MKKLIIPSLCFLFLAACSGNKLLKDYPEKENLEAALDASKISSELRWKNSICEMLNDKNFSDVAESTQFKRNKNNALQYYEENVSNFNKKIDSYLDDYNKSYGDSFKNEDMYHVYDEIVGKPSRINTAKYFNINSSDVEEVLSSNDAGGFNNNYFSIMISSIGKQNDPEFVIRKCNEFYKDIFDSKYNPNFSKYKSEYKQITGLSGINN
ncbi:hypothetical protein [Acinetobacter soli]|uniref:hypothetical protein n=1 Tax=Acinetobacter soli TaxID=487316 RepID=UPI000DCF679D|nr:hypothetical protein [Acinetobacter soli]